MSSGTARVGSKGNRKEGLDMGAISKEELTELQDGLKTEHEREDLEGRFKDASTISGLNVLFMVSTQLIFVVINYIE